MIAFVRQLAERRAKSMEEEINLLQRSLQEKDGELQASASSAELVGQFGFLYSNAIF